MTVAQSSLPYLNRAKLGRGPDIELMPDKKSLSERDICIKFITMAVVRDSFDSATKFLERVSLIDGAHRLLHTELKQAFEPKGICK